MHVHWLQQYDPCVTHCVCTLVCTYTSLVPRRRWGEKAAIFFRCHLKPGYEASTYTCIHAVWLRFCFLRVSTPATQPVWNQLIAVRSWKGFGQRSIIDFIALHSPAQCNDFAHLLLDDRMFVLATRREKPGNDEFIRAVLQKWFASVGGDALPCTWSDLIQCMKSSGLDSVTIKIIEDNIFQEIRKVSDCLVVPPCDSFILPLSLSLFLSLSLSLSLPLPFIL